MSVIGPSRDRRRVADRLRAAGLTLEATDVYCRVGYYRRVRDLPRWWADAERDGERVMVESYYLLAEAARAPLRLLPAETFHDVLTLIAEPMP